jgi:hypothetical protein
MRSVVPAGLDGLGSGLPSVKTLGYFGCIVSLFVQH